LVSQTELRSEHIWTPVSEQTSPKRQDIGLWDQIREDWAMSGRLTAFVRPGFHVMVVHRFGSRLRHLPRPLRRPLLIPLMLLNYYCRFYYGIELPFATTVGRRVVIAHQSGIVIDHRADIGDDCLIRHNATIGPARLERGVQVGAGSVIEGKITIGEGARIGANAVVTRDVPAGATAFASPARVMNFPRKAGLPAYERPEDHS